MKIALVNPNWNFEGSIYFGCRQPHLPLELGIASRMLRDAGHQVELIDGHLFGLSLADTAAVASSTLTALSSKQAHALARRAGFRSRPIL